MVFVVLGLKKSNHTPDNAVLFKKIKKSHFHHVFCAKVVKNCIENLNKLGETCKIELKWVKGHAFHTGNELADFLAKTGTKNESNKVDLPPPKNIAKRK